MSNPRRTEMKNESELKSALFLFVIPVIRNQGAVHPMMGTVLMLFFGLPEMTRSL